jgi:SOS-response transcriptional repressor LexA
MKPVLSPGSRPAWAEKIALLRRELGITQVVLAKRLEVKQPSVSGWEIGEYKPTAANFFALAEMAPAGELRDYFHSMAERVAGLKLDRGDQPSGKKGPQPVAQEGFARVPLLKDSAAAGSPRQLDERAIESYIEFPAAWCPKPQNCVAIRVTGDSMSPILEEGYVVLIDLTQKDPKRLVNEMVAARDSEGGVTIKWLRKIGKYFMLVPQHTSQRHEPQMIESDDDWAVVGKVIRWIGEPPKSKRR